MIHAPDTMWIDGIDSAEYGIHVLKLPPVQKAQKNIQPITIPGRSGVLTRWNGDYLPYQNRTSLYYDGTDRTGTATILNNATNLRWSNDEEYVHDVIAVSPIELSELLFDEHEFDFEVTLQPLKYLAVPESPRIGTSVVINNQTDTIAFPRIEVTTTGTVTITAGTDTITVTGVTGTLILDSLLGIVKDGSGNAWGRLTGRLPEIKPGEIMTISSAESMTVRPQWRWA